MIFRSNLDPDFDADPDFFDLNSYFNQDINLVLDWDQYFRFRSGFDLDLDLVFISIFRCNV